MKFWFKNGAWASASARRRIASLAPAAVRRIAVIRHAALGDMVLTRPFLIELRRHFPNARITLSLATHYMHGAPRDLVDRVHVACGNDRKDVPLREQIRRARELGEQDLLFDLAATPRSFCVCVLNRAGLKIGFPHRALQRVLFYDAAVWRSDFKFEAETLLDMLHLLGLKTAHPLRYALPGAPATRDRPYVVYFAGASTRYKCWPPDRFGELIRRMAEHCPAFDHLVLEGRDAWESAEALLGALPETARVSVLKNVGLDETIALLKGARLLVSNDTGIRNLAAAAGTPTVGIFFATPPFIYWPRLAIHDAVFDADGTPPSVDDVFTSARALLDGMIVAEGGAPPPRRIVYPGRGLSAAASVPAPALAPFDGESEDRRWDEGPGTRTHSAQAPADQPPAEQEPEPRG